MPSCGSLCDRVIFPSSSMFFTVTVIVLELLLLPSVALTTTSYTLSPSAESIASKLGGSPANRSAALPRLAAMVAASASVASSVLIFMMSKRLASTPLSDQLILSFAPSGSAASNTGRPVVVATLDPMVDGSNGFSSSVSTTKSLPLMARVAPAAKSSSGSRVIVGGSSTCATLMVTIAVLVAFEGSVAVIVTTYCNARVTGGSAVGAASLVA